MKEFSFTCAMMLLFYFIGALSGSRGAWREADDLWRARVTYQQDYCAAVRSEVLALDSRKALEAE